MSRSEKSKLSEIVEREMPTRGFLILHTEHGDLNVVTEEVARAIAMNVALAVVEDLKATIQRGTISGLCASGWLIAELDALTGPNSERCSHGVWGGDHCWKCDDGQREDERR